MDSYTLARTYTAGTALSLAGGAVCLNWYGWQIAAAWAALAVLLAVCARIDQQDVRRRKARRRAYNRAHTVYVERTWGEAMLRRELPKPSYGGTLCLVDYPLDLHSVAADRIADLLITEDHRRIRLAEENRA